MKVTIVLICFLLATASPTGERSAKFSHSLPSHARYLTHLTTASDFLFPTIFTVCGSLLALSLVAVHTKSYVWLRNDKVEKNGARLDFSPGPVIPLYVHRVTQERMQSAAKRPVTQVNRLPASSASTVKEATEGDGRELWKKRRQMLREKRKERRAKGPLIDPEVLKRINQEWQLIYGFTNRDLFHIENELENTVAKIRSVYSKKDKAIKFDDSVHVMFVEKENKGRRVKRSRKMEKNATKCDTESHSAAYIQFIV